MNLIQLPALDIPADDILVLDFETYWADDYTLSKMTNESYVRDPRFEVIGCGLSVGGSDALWFAGREAVAEAFRQVDWKRTVVLAHHAQFDGLILSHVFGIRPAFWLDTLSMSRGVVHATEAGGSLASLAKRFGVGEKGTEVLNSKNKRLADFTPDELERYGAYCRNDVALTYQIFLHLMQARGGFPPAELWQIDATVRMATEPAFVADHRLLTEAVADERLKKSVLLGAAAGFPLAIEARDRMRKSAEARRTDPDGPVDVHHWADYAQAYVAQRKPEDEELIRSHLVSNDKFAAVLADLGVDPPRKTSPTTGKETWAFAKSDPGFASLLEHESDEVRWVAEARVGVKSTIDETRADRMKSIGTRGAVPIYLKYCGAHTGRWSGGDRFNPQNLRRGGVLRDALLAEDGYVVVAVDSGQIEARGNGWLWDHTALLAGFTAQDADPKATEDVYTREASRAFGRVITKKNKVERGVGKFEVLGLGYSMGWLKLAMNLAAGPMGAAPVIFDAAACDAVGVDVDAFAAKFSDRVAEMPSRLAMDARLAHCAMSRHLVESYRGNNGPIVDGWPECDEAIEIMSSLGEGESFAWRHGLELHRHALRLPSGRWLRYPGLRQTESGWVFQSGARGEKIVHIYGGLLTENIVQAISRDVVAEQALAIRLETGYSTVTMTHDENVWIVPGRVVPSKEKDKAPELLGEVASFLPVALSYMKRAPAWAAGWPLNAEGGAGKRYGECKG